MSLIGVQITDIIKGEEISFEHLFDKKIAIDAYNWIYQFLSIIRQPDGTPLQDSKGRTTSHLSGLYYRTIKLMGAGIKPIYVFDGEPPDFKKQTNEQRRDVRSEAAREWKKALERGDIEAAKKHAQRSVSINEEIIDSGKHLLKSMGLPVLQAPSEGEALCSVIVKNGDAYAVATQDYDSLLFGATRLVRNLSITGKRKRGDKIITINPEMFLLKNILEELGLSGSQLIILGILVGTDYNPGGVSGFGPKRALELVKEKKTLEAVLKNNPWEFDISAKDIFDFFKSPPAGDYKIIFSEMDEEKVKKLLCDEHDFSEERIDSSLKKLQESKKEQKSLNRWF